MMQLVDVFVGLGEPMFGDLLGRISLGRLRSFQIFDQIRARARLQKLNAGHLRKAAPRLWARLGEGDTDLASDLAQAVLVSHLELIVAVLDLLGVPHQDGFFAKDQDTASYLGEGWQQRAWDALREQHPASVLVFYLNHLAVETARAEEVFQPAA
jgi:hypothetical protein